MYSFSKIKLEIIIQCGKVFEILLNMIIGKLYTVFNRKLSIKTLCKIQLDKKKKRKRKIIKCLVAINVLNYSFVQIKNK